MLEMLREAIQIADDLKAGCVRVGVQRRQLVIVHNARLFTHPLSQTIPVMEVPAARSPIQCSP
ncbi:hypothetical protein D3C76_1347980 [compost metagenome]